MMNYEGMSPEQKRSYGFNKLTREELGLLSLATRRQKKSSVQIVNQATN